MDKFQNRIQGEEDTGFMNELSPEQIKQLLAMAQKTPPMTAPLPSPSPTLNRSPAGMGESRDVDMGMGKYSKSMPNVSDTGEKSVPDANVSEKLKELMRTLNLKPLTEEEQMELDKSKGLPHIRTDVDELYSPEMVFGKKVEDMVPETITPESEYMKPYLNPKKFNKIKSKVK